MRIGWNYSGMILITVFVVSFCITMVVVTDSNQYTVCEDTMKGTRGEMYFLTPEHTVEYIHFNISEEEYRNSMTLLGMRQGTVLFTSPVELIGEDRCVKQIGDFIMERYDSDYERANAAVFFVQTALTYMEDKVLYGVDEYWARPIETLYNRAGDCEDSAVLFVSICRYMGLDAILLEKDTHVGSAVCVDCDRPYFYEYNGKRYYSCITSTDYYAYHVGEKLIEDMEIVEGQIPFVYYFYSLYKQIGDNIRYHIPGVA